MYELTFWPINVISETPCSASLATSSKIWSGFLLTSSPLVYGTTQKEQYLEHPSIIATKLEGPAEVGEGSESNFSSIGKVISIALIPLL